MQRRFARRCNRERPVLRYEIRREIFPQISERSLSKSLAQQMMDLSDRREFGKIVPTE
jgi:hypothetical protein